MVESRATASIDRHITWYPTVFHEVFKMGTARALIAGKIPAGQRKMLRGYVEFARDIGGGLSAVSVRYGRKKYGRFNPEVSDSPKGKHAFRWTGCRMMSGIRNILFSNHYVDLDFVNCHPRIALTLFDAAGFPTTELKKYVDNRDSVLRTLMGAYPDGSIDRDRAKNLFIRLLFGGRVSAWATDYAVRADPAQSIVGPLETEFHGDVSKIIDKYPQFSTFAEENRDPTDNRNVVFRAFAFLCQDIERRALEIVVECAQRDGFECGSLIFDGLHVRREKPLTPDILRSWESAVNRGVGIPLQIVVKEMSCDDTLLIPDETIVDMSYESVRESFERTHCRVRAQNAIYETSERGIRSMSSRELADSYSNYVYHKKGKERQFIPKWLKDPKSRTYVDAGIYPPPKILPNGFLNLYNGFAAARITTPPDPEGGRILLDHLRLMCNNDELSFQFVIRWIAHLIKWPGVKPGVALIFRSATMGVGKSAISQIIRSLVGGEACHSIADSDLITGSFNNLLLGTFLITFEEYRHDRRTSRYLNDLITHDVDTIHLKGRSAFPTPSVCRLLFMSNLANVMDISPTDRRYWVANVIAAKQPRGYYERLFAAIDSSGAVRFLHEYLLKVDVSPNYDFSGNRPLSDYYYELRRASVPIILVALAECLRESIKGLDLLPDSISVNLATITSKFNSLRGNAAKPLCGRLVGVEITGAGPKGICKYGLHGVAHYKYVLPDSLQWLFQVGAIDPESMETLPGFRSCPRRPSDI